MTKKQNTKRKIRTLSLFLVGIGLTGVFLSFVIEKRYADQLHKQVADIEQNQESFDQLKAEDISNFSKLESLFNNDQWQNILDKQSKNSVTQEWVLASSIIVTLSGGLILGWFAAVWFCKVFAEIFRKLSGRVVVRCRANTNSSALTGRFSRKRFGGLCWTSKDMVVKKDQPGSPAADTNKNAAGSKKSQPRHHSQQPKPAEPVASPAFQKCQPNHASNTQQEISVADVLSPTIEEPISVLKDLSEHVSAIREYATLQQGRMEKLQDGYDWNIIRTFCLRIIRCIDNIELRIKLLGEKGVDVSDLLEVQDELIFALESSSVERFSPDLNSDYCGQEKKLEASKDKILSDDPSMNGKIAEVVRCGYYHVIEDDNIKVIRPSQVKLFGKTESGQARGEQANIVSSLNGTNL